MQELRLVAVSEDGTYLVLASAGRGTRFTLPVDDRLRAAVRGQFSRLGQYEIEVENPLRPKEIQARIRSGETAEAIAEAAGIPIERVRWFEGPVLQEREYMAQQAQRATVRRPGESSPGPVLGDLVADRIGRHQLETGDAVWDSWKRDDGTWLVKLAFLIEGEERVAHWTFDARRRSVNPADEEAVRFSAPEPEEPLDLGPADTGAGATVTPFVPRRQGPAEPALRPEPAAPAEPVARAAEPAAPAGRVSVTAERARPGAGATAAGPRPADTPPRAEPAPAGDPERPAAGAQRPG
ncbi:septation protein SepH, partial [Marinitenerispora sediminis]